MRTLLRIITEMANRFLMYTWDKHDAGYRFILLLFICLLPMLSYHVLWIVNINYYRPQVGHASRTCDPHNKIYSGCRHWTINPIHRRASGQEVSLHGSTSCLRSPRAVSDPGPKIPRKSLTKSECSECIGNPTRTHLNVVVLHQQFYTFFATI